MEYIKTLNIDFHNLPENSETRYILKTTISIISYIKEHPELKELKEKNKLEYEDKIFEQYKEFSEKYFSLFMMIIDGSVDFDTLMNIFKIKAAIEMKMIDHTVGDTYITELLSEKYLYPTFGSKEKFYEAIEKEMNRKQKRELEKQKELIKKNLEIKKHHAELNKKNKK